MLDILDEEPYQMQSIQETKEEEDEDLETYKLGMRTGLSIEDDEHEDEFNHRVGTHYQSSDVRDDIDDMMVAGTKTQLQYQEEEKEETLQINNDIQNEEEIHKRRDSIPSNNDDYNEEAYQETIPVDTPHDATQFSIHNSATQFSVHEPNTQIISPDSKKESKSTSKKIESPNKSNYDNTTFSVKQVDNKEEEKDDEIDDNTPVEPGKKL